MSGESRKVWFLRHPYAACFLVLLFSFPLCFAFVLWMGYLLFGPDPCDGWRPGMTKDEKILMALKDANKSNSLSFEFVSSQAGDTYRNLVKQVPYRNAESILLEQPNCCHVYGWDSALTDAPKPLDESLGGDEGVVVLRYIGKYKDRGTGAIHTAPTFTYLNLNICKTKKRKF